MSLFTAHPSALIDPGATIGENTRIWHFSHVCAGAQIGANCLLGQNVYVAGGARIGDGSKIQHNVSTVDCVQPADAVLVGLSAVLTNLRDARAPVSRRAAFTATLAVRVASIAAH